jgi:hypothetical protein|tara:strand:+ start:2966 stop:3772 length:807 start_codon:yes stop_codon:yes gene_type:complete
MAISAALGVGKKIVGKAIKAAKKKKKDLEKTKAGKKVKETVSKAAEKTKEQIKPSIEKIKKGARTASVKVRRKAGPKVREGVRKAAQVTAAGGIGAAGVAAATAATPTLMGAGVGAGIGAGLSKDPMKGLKKGGIIGGALGLAASAGLTASILKKSTPDEAQYTTKKDAGGSFVTQLGKGKNANIFTSSKQLTGKDLDIVRKGIAIMDSILLSDNPKSRQKEFMEIAMYLSAKHGITSIQGANLNVVIPQGLNEKGNRNLLVRHEGKF